MVRYELPWCCWCTNCRQLADTRHALRSIIIFRYLVGSSHHAHAERDPPQIATAPERAFSPSISSHLDDFATFIEHPAYLLGSGSLRLSGHMNEDQDHHSITPTKESCVQLVRALGRSYLQPHLRSQYAAEKGRLEGLLKQLECAQRRRSSVEKRMR